MRISDWSSDVCSSDFGLYGLAWRHQWRPCVLDILDQAVLVIGVLGAGRVLDAAFLDHAEQRRDFLGTAAEADAHDADLRIRVFTEPYFGLLAELIVRRLHAPLERKAGYAIYIACDRIVLGEGAFDVRS